LGSRLGWGRGWYLTVAAAPGVIEDRSAEARGNTRAFLDSLHIVWSSQKSGGNSWGLGFPMSMKIRETWDQRRLFVSEDRGGR
jgi:hypothetical protein